MAAALFSFSVGHKTLLFSVVLPASVSVSLPASQHRDFLFFLVMSAESLKAHESRTPLLIFVICTFSIQDADAALCPLISPNVLQTAADIWLSCWENINAAQGRLTILKISERRLHLL